MFTACNPLALLVETPFGGLQTLVNYSWIRCFREPLTQDSLVLSVNVYRRCIGLMYPQQHLSWRSSCHPSSSSPSDTGNNSSIFHSRHSDESVFKFHRASPARKSIFVWVEKVSRERDSRTLLFATFIHSTGRVRPVTHLQRGSILVRELGTFTRGCTPSNEKYDFDQFKHQSALQGFLKARKT